MQVRESTEREGGRELESDILMVWGNVGVEGGVLGGLGREVEAGLEKKKKNGWGRETGG